MNFEKAASIALIIIAISIAVVAVALSVGVFTGVITG